MKKLLLTSLLCCTAMMAMATDGTGTISVAAASGSAGSTVKMNVTMEATVNDACAFQCDIVLPSGVSLANPVNLTATSANHTVASNLLEGNKYRLVCYSMTNAVMSNGNVASFDIVAPSTDGTYTFTVENVEIVSLATIEAIASNGGSGDLTVGGSKFGDISGNDIVDTGDLTLLLNMLKGTAPETAVADLSGNDIVDTADLTILINLLK